MNLIKRLKTYQKKNKLSNQVLRDQLKDAGLQVSTATVGNWMRNDTEPSNMYRQGLENFLTEVAND